jgi:hypothetical protein
VHSCVGKCMGHGISQSPVCAANFRIAMCSVYKQSFFAMARAAAETAAALRMRLGAACVLFHILRPATGAPPLVCGGRS